MQDHQYIRKVQTSVTNFLKCGDDYLFLHRNTNKKVDPNRLNGIGGRLELGENYLDAAIRETEEETGYVVKPEDVVFAGMIKLEGGYSEDWIVACFVINVSNKKIPHGTETEDGTLMWVHKDKVLDSEYELVDDLNYCWKDIIVGKEVFFMTAQLNEKEKIINFNLSKLSK